MPEELGQPGFPIKQAAIDLIRGRDLLPPDPDIGTLHDGISWSADAGDEEGASACAPPLTKPTSASAADEA